MANKIQFKRGVYASLPTLNDGEAGWCTDTFQLFIGQGSANKLVGEPDFLKLSGGSLTNFLTLHADPTSDLHAATKQYVDAIASGLDLKASCRVATAAALPAYTRTGNVITATGNGALANIDGVTLVLNDRLLVKDGVADSDNGLYYVSAVGDAGNPYTLTRTTDADTSAEVNAGLFTFIEEGTANGDNGFVLTTNNPITLNTTGLTFSQFSGGGHTQNTDTGTTSVTFTLDTTLGILSSAAASTAKTWTFPNLTGGVLLDVSDIDGGAF